MPSSDPQLDSAHGICAITGASGYVGSRIAARLAGVNWQIRSLCRSPASGRQSPANAAHFELGGELEPGILAGADALVHLAYDFAPTRWSEIERVNVEGSRRLFAAAREARVRRIVLVSTIAAFPGARSSYGRAKLEIERAALDVGAAIVRPGLVWGPRGAAMFGALQHAVERLPIVPLLGPPKLELNLVHEDDLALLVERLLDRWPQGSGELFVAASERALTFADLLRSLAARAGKRPRFVQVPWRAAWLGLRVLEGAGVRPPFRSDSLVSFVSIDTDPFSRATGSTERFGVRFRPYAST
jgi:nucleoside-diphosphate-sugar epimerase